MAIRKLILAFERSDSRCDCGCQGYMLIPNDPSILSTPSIVGIRAISVAPIVTPGSSCCTPSTISKCGKCTVEVQFDDSVLADPNVILTQCDFKNGGCCYDCTMQYVDKKIVTSEIYLDLPVTTYNPTTNILHLQLTNGSSKDLTITPTFTVADVCGYFTGSPV